MASSSPRHRRRVEPVPVGDIGFESDIGASPTKAALSSVNKKSSTPPPPKRRSARLTRNNSAGAATSAAVTSDLTGLVGVKRKPRGSMRPNSKAPATAATAARDLDFEDAAVYSPDSTTISSKKPSLKATPPPKNKTLLQQQMSPATEECPADVIVGKPKKTPTKAAETSSDAALLLPKSYRVLLLQFRSLDDILALAGQRTRGNGQQLTRPDTFDALEFMVKNATARDFPIERLQQLVTVAPDMVKLSWLPKAAGGSEEFPGASWTSRTEVNTKNAHKQSTRWHARLKVSVQNPDDDESATEMTAVERAARFEKLLLTKVMATYRKWADEKGVSVHPEDPPVLDPAFDVDAACPMIAPTPLPVDPASQRAQSNDRSSVHRALSGSPARSASVRRGMLLTSALSKTPTNASKITVRLSSLDRNSCHRALSPATPGLKNAGKADATTPSAAPFTMPKVDMSKSPAERRAALLEKIRARAEQNKKDVQAYNDDLKLRTGETQEVLGTLVAASEISELESLASLVSALGAYLAPRAGELKGPQRGFLTSAIKHLSQRYAEFATTDVKQLIYLLCKTLPDFAQILVEREAEIVRLECTTPEAVVSAKAKLRELIKQKTAAFEAMGA